MDPELARYRYQRQTINCVHSISILAGLIPKLTIIAIVRAGRAKVLE